MIAKETKEVFYVDFSEQEQTFQVDFDNVIVVAGEGGEPYVGTYVVTPAVRRQSLPTKDRFMVEDVTINPIPYYEVTNNTGGNTVTIGG